MVTLSIPAESKMFVSFSGFRLFMKRRALKQALSLIEVEGKKPSTGQVKKIGDKVYATFPSLTDCELSPLGEERGVQLLPNCNVK